MATECQESAEEAPRPNRSSQPPNRVIDIGTLSRLDQLERGSLIQSHRVMIPSARTIGVVSSTTTRWP